MKTRTVDIMVYGSQYWNMYKPDLKNSRDGLAENIKGLKNAEH